MGKINGLDEYDSNRNFPFTTEEEQTEDNGSGG